jgi:putative transferase (TIGR04331 family)
LKLLVTTALEETWGSTEKDIVFLGKWCIPYGKGINLKNKEYKIIPFHWDDRNKLLDDYNYLHKLHSDILTKLMEYLNIYHKSNYSLKFWQILLDPWLLNYLSVQLDRWENLRFLFQESDESYYKIVYPELSVKIPFDYNDFVDYSFSEEFNEFIFNKIIKYKYNNRIKFIENSKNLKENNFHSNFDSKSGDKKKSLIDIHYSIIRFLFPNTDVISIETSIRGGFLSRIKLQWKLKKIIFFYVPELNRSITKFFKRKFDNYGPKNRKLGILESFNANSEFESFIRYNILGDLPLSVVESFVILRDYTNNIPIKPKIILTAGAHWGNTLAKFWFAIKQESGTKLIICEHGGSLPAYQELLNFEEDISYLKATWFLPYHPKHVKLPPFKLIGLYNKWKSKNNEICSIIGNETPKYVFRIHFYALSSQFLYSFSDIQLFYENLAPKIKLKTLFRPYYDYGWNTGEMLNEFFKNKNLIFREESFESLLKRSKIVICTYPETTFSEAMVIGVPTILIYNPKFNERNAVTEKVINLLLDARIIFNNPIDASNHLNLIWDDVGDWWNSSKVKYARNVFLEQATFPHKDWNIIWSKFLNKVLSEK